MTGPLAPPNIAAMRSRAALLMFSFGLVAGVAGCGGSDKACYDDRSCDTGERCVIEEAGEAGTCGPCDATETPYDGIDNDCNERTRDIDLDGDGQNAIDSAYAPGTDCDDNDPLVRRAGPDAEVCGDGKDNNCNGEIDEPQCADTAPPTIRFLSPANGAVVSGQIVLQVQIDDDVGAQTLVVQANGAEVSRASLTPQPQITQQVTLPTTSLPDGTVTLRAEAQDLLDRTGSVSITVTVDNVTPPEITIGRPMAGGTYGGYFTTTATVTDASGVARVEIEIDGTVTATLTEAPWTARVDTSSLADGAHDVLFRAFDVNESMATAEVTVDVDNTPPFIAFTTPTAGQVVSGLVPITVTSSDATGVAEIRSDLGVVGPSPLNYSVDTTVLPNGALTLSAEAEDTVVVDDGTAAGNVATASVTFTIENIDPTPLVSFVQPMQNDGVFAATPLEVAVTSPASLGIAGVDFIVEGRTVGTVATAPYLFTYDFSTHTGTVGVTARAVDVDGNEGFASVVVDKVPAPNFRVSPSSIATGIAAQAGVQVGDVDRDGVQDVVVGSSSLLVFTGTVSAGGAEWRPTLSQTLSQASLRDLRLVDVDQDMWLDVVGFSADRARVFLNDGMGGFMAPTEYTFPQGGMVAFDVGDLDGDQDLDVVVVGGTSPGVVGYTLLAEPDGSYVLGQVLGGDSGASDVELADIDDDGDTDVIIGRSTTAVLSIYFNNGAGGFGAGQDTTTAAPMGDVEVADMNGSGTLDVVVELADGFQVLPVLNTTPFQIVAGPRVTAGTPSGIVAADLEGSNLTDVLVIDSLAHGVMILENGVATPSGFDTSRQYVVGSRFANAILADVDGDNALDIVGLSPTDSSLIWARNIGTGEFLATETLRAPRLQVDPTDPTAVVQLVPSSIGVGDVLVGAGSELIVNFAGRASVHNPQLVIYQRIGGQLLITGALVLPTGIDPPDLFAVGGASQTSGYAYMVVGTKTTAPSTPGTNTMTIVESQPPNFLSLNLTLDYMTDIQLGDVDNDNLTDIQIAFDEPGVTTDGAAMIAPDLSIVRGPYNLGAGAASIAVGDLDADPLGRQDFAVANTVSENITVHLWNGATFNSTQYNAPTGLGAIITGRVNDDIYEDIVGIGGTNTIFVMEGDPSFGFRTPTSYPAGTGATKIVGGDFNGDGNFDVMTLNGGDKMALMLARPQGGFFAPITISTGAGPVDMRTADLDGDGRPDIVFANATKPSMSYMYNDADTL